MSTMMSFVPDQFPTKNNEVDVTDSSALSEDTTVTDHATMKPTDSQENSPQLSPRALPPASPAIVGEYILPECAVVGASTDRMGDGQAVVTRQYTITAPADGSVHLPAMPRTILASPTIRTRTTMGAFTPGGTGSVSAFQAVGQYHSPKTATVLSAAATSPRSPTTATPYPYYNSSPSVVRSAWPTASPTPATQQPYASVYPSNNVTPTAAKPAFTFNDGYGQTAQDTLHTSFAKTASGVWVQPSYTSLFTRNTQNQPMPMQTAYQGLVRGTPSASPITVPGGFTMRNTAPRCVPSHAPQTQHGHHHHDGEYPLDINGSLLRTIKLPYNADTLPTSISKPTIRHIRPVKSAWCC